MKWHNWTVFFLGIWFAVSPWALGFSAVNLARWNAVATGALAAVFALWNMTPRDE